MSTYKNFINILITSGFLTGLSFLSYQFCNWYGCNGWISFMRSDLICNACVDISYHLKNYQISLYGSIFTLVTYQMTTLINRTSSLTESYVFEEYELGKKSPRSLKVK
jgi:hypothetical protein